MIDILSIYEEYQTATTYLHLCTRFVYIGNDPSLPPGDELAILMQGLMGAQANDSGWPTFNGKYMEYPRFRKEWRAYRQTYHGHMRDELVCRSLTERNLAGSVKILVNDIDDLREA
jgi:hypothetical protein